MGGVDYLEDEEMSRAEPFSILAARLQARKPWLTWSQICSELGGRPKRRKPVAEKPKNYWWQKD